MWQRGTRRTGGLCRWSRDDRDRSGLRLAKFFSCKRTTRTAANSKNAHLITLNNEHGSENIRLFSKQQLPELALYFPMLCRYAASLRITCKCCLRSLKTG
jgi:hypothetical protein